MFRTTTSRWWWYHTRLGCSFSSTLAVTTIAQDITKTQFVVVVANTVPGTCRRFSQGSIKDYFSGRFVLFSIIVMPRYFSAYVRGAGRAASARGQLFVPWKLHRVKSRQKKYSPSREKAYRMHNSRKLSYFPKLSFKSYNTQLSKTFVAGIFLLLAFSARKTLRHIDILGFGTNPLPWPHLSLSLHTWHHIILMFTPLDKSVEEIFAWESKIILFWHVSSCTLGKCRPDILNELKVILFSVLASNSRVCL